MKKFLWGIVSVCLLGVTVASAASLSTMEDYLESYCDDVDPVRYCGSYQDDIDDAHDKLVRLHTVLDNYDTSTRHAIRDQLVDEFADMFDDSRTTRVKILAAYYSLVMEDTERDDFDTDDVLAYLFDDEPLRATSYNSSRYTSTRTTTSPSRYTSVSSTRNGQLRTFSTTDGRTRINVSRREIEVGGRTMEMRITALNDDDKVATLQQGYRVVAEIDNQTYAASHTRNGIWEFRFGDSLRSGDEITFLLLCKTCSRGERYYSATALDGWYVVDAEEFEIVGNLDRSSPSSRYASNRYTSSSSRNYDLAVRDVEWRYDISGNDVEVRLTTTVSNEGRYDNVLEELNYTIEVDNDRLSSREYDIRHIRTDCDDRRVSSSQDDDIRVDEDDECEVTVEITLDRDDTEDEYVEIEVELEAERDDYSSNNSEVVRFRAD